MQRRPIEFATCHDAKVVVWPYLESNPVRLMVLAGKSEDYTTEPQHLQSVVRHYWEGDEKMSSFRERGWRQYYLL